MYDEAHEGTVDESPDAPLPVGARDVLVPQPEHDGQVDAEEPHVAGKAVEHAPYQRLLARHAGHLPVCRVAEVGQHQQHHAADVVRQVGIVEHPASTYSQEDAEDGDHVRMDVELIPEQGERQADGTGEVDVEPLLGVLRFHRQP